MRGRLNVGVLGVPSGLVKVRRGDFKVVVRKAKVLRLRWGVYTLSAKAVLHDGWWYHPTRDQKKVRVGPRRRSVVFKYKPIPIPPDPVPAGSILEMVSLVNSIRRQHGLNELTYNWGLAQAAYGHAKDMADRNYFDHKSPEGGTFVERIQATNYRGAPAGENIASGFPDAHSTFRGWMNSQHHRDNLLNPWFNNHGLARVERYDPGYSLPIVYWVHNFGYDPAFD